MKLARIEVTSYRSLFAGENRIFSLDLADGMNTLIGPNNCGKSNVLRAVALALDPAFPFDRERDKPAAWAWSFTRATLQFQSDRRTSPERTLLDRAHRYEMSVNGGNEETYARDGIVRLTVSFNSAGRHESVFVRGAGAREGDPDLRDQVLAQLRRCIRFVLIESGQSLEALLAGKFREILHTVIQEHLRDELERAARRRAGYVESLQDELLDPLRQRIRSVVGDLFPEVKDVRLVPQVSGIEETLSNVAVNITDALETSLAAKGTGVRGAVMVAMLRYLADQSRRSIVFAVEEPEAFLHPGAQENLRDDLEALARRRDVTLLVTTHSPFVVSRASAAKVIALAKDSEGRTHVSGIAHGDEPHASLLGGLFRDAALPDILDRSALLPRDARGILVVEGISDEQFLKLAARKLRRQDLLEGIFVSAAGGAEKTVVQAVLMKQQTPAPVLVLLDTDDIGRACKDNLLKRFAFSKKEVLTYLDVTPDRQLEGVVEAEDLFPPAQLAAFVAAKGEDRVVKAKVMTPRGWRFDLNETGKEFFPEWIAEHGKTADFECWLALLLEVRRRLGLEAAGH